MTYKMNWRDFQKNIARSCIGWREEDDFTDVTLVSGDGKFHRAHKIILSSGSTFFMNILQNAKHPQPLIVLKGIKDHNLNAILDYLYFGEVTIHQEYLNDFFAEAEEYLLKGLDEINIEMQGEVMKNSLNNQNEQLIYDNTESKPKLEDNLDDCSKFNESKINPQVLAAEVKETTEEDYILKELGLSEPEPAPKVQIKEDIDEPVIANESHSNIHVVADDEEAKRREYLRKLTLQFVADDKKAKRQEYLRKIKASKVDKFKVQFEGDSEKDLKLTINTMINEIGSHFFCKVCKKTPSTNRSAIEQHVKDFHITGLSFKCKLCDKKLRSGNALYTHNYRHHHTRN